MEARLSILRTIGLGVGTNGTSKPVSVMTFPT
jgi:hypothetical protein